MILNRLHLLVPLVGINFFVICHPSAAQDKKPLGKINAELGKQIIPTDTLPKDTSVSGSVSKLADPSLLLDPDDEPVVAQPGAPSTTLFEQPPTSAGVLLGEKAAPPPRPPANVDIPSFVNQASKGEVAPTTAPAPAAAPAPATTASTSAAAENTAEEPSALGLPEDAAPLLETPKTAATAPAAPAGANTSVSVSVEANSATAPSALGAPIASPFTSPEPKKTAEAAPAKAAEPTPPAAAAPVVADKPVPPTPAVAKSVIDATEKPATTPPPNLGPTMAGATLPGFGVTAPPANRQPASATTAAPASPPYAPAKNPSLLPEKTSLGEETATTPQLKILLTGKSQSDEKVSLERSTLTAVPVGPEVSVILANNRFFPSRIRLRAGQITRIYFTTVNRKPAALILDRLNLQRWVAREERVGNTEMERAQWELTREVASLKMTEVTIDPRRGTYSFHDALSGASGEIVVE